MAQNASLTPDRMQTLASLPKFVDNTLLIPSNDWIICQWSSVDNFCLHATLYHDTIMSSVQTCLHMHFNSYFPLKFRRIRLPNCSWLFTNILAFPVPDVPQY